MRITKKELLAYLQVEEDEDTAELLTTASLLFVGAAVRGDVTLHYWSYPSCDGVSWLSYSSDRVLSTEVAVDVPLSIKEMTTAREAHPMRRARHHFPSPDRTPIDSLIWVPHQHAPRCNYYTVWQENFPFQQVLSILKAKAKKENVGYSLLGVCVKLSSGRYAAIDTREDRQSSINISLEMHEDEESRKDENCMGFVYVKDIQEVLAALGIGYQAPRQRFPYQWRE